jgi:hypothetical protein
VGPIPLITLTMTSIEFGEISIVQSRVAGSHIYWQEGWAQSEADRNGVSLTAYVHAIFGLVAQTSAHATLTIGCGGGTLGTMLIDAGRSVLVSPGPVERNAIVMGGAVATLHEPSLLMKPEVLQDEIMAELQGMRFRGGCRSWNSPTADENDCSEQTP